jgi:acyl-CoA dehydrogenase
MNALSGGVFHTGAADDDGADLRRLVDDIGRRSFDAKIGTRRVPEQFDDDLWRNLEDAGLTRLTSTPDLEAGPEELAVVLCGVARHAGAVPVAETDALACWLATQAGVDVPDGPLTVAIADADLVGGRLAGTAIEVPWTRAAASVLLAVRGGGELRVGQLDLGDASVEDGHNLAGEPRDRITFDVAAAELTTVDGELADELALRGAWCRCVQIIGALDAAAAMTVQHTRERVQFGRPLSKLQAVQHSLASMAGEIERARAAAALAVAAATDHGFGSAQTDYAVTVAKVSVGQAVGTVTTIAHQLHGAIGVTAEHPLWSATMRAQSWTRDYGTTAHHARRLGRMTLAADEPWDLVIGILT